MPRTGWTLCAASIGCLATQSGDFGAIRRPPVVAAPVPSSPVNLPAWLALDDVGPAAGTDTLRESAYRNSSATRSISNESRHWPSGVRSRRRAVPIALKPTAV